MTEQVKKEAKERQLKRAKNPNKIEIHPEDLFSINLKYYRPLISKCIKEIVESKIEETQPYLLAW